MAYPNIFTTVRTSGAFPDGRLRPRRPSTPAWKASEGCTYRNLAGEAGNVPARRNPNHRPLLPYREEKKTKGRDGCTISPLAIHFSVVPTSVLASVFAEDATLADTAESCRQAAAHYWGTTFTVTVAT